MLAYCFPTCITTYLDCSICGIRLFMVSLLYYNIIVLLLFVIVSVYLRFIYVVCVIVCLVSLFVYLYILFLYMHLRFICVFMLIYLFRNINVSLDCYCNIFDFVIVRLC